MNRIKELRKAHKMSQLELAEKFNVHQTAVSQWENNRTNPDFELLKSIADFFEVSVDYLLGRSDISNVEPYSFGNKKGIKVPVYGSVAAGVPIEAIEDIIDYEEIDEETARHGEHFALKISGDSMETLINDGDVVIVRKQPAVESGDIAIVYVNGFDATCKKVIVQENGINLVSLNPNYAPMFYSNEQIDELPVRIIGKVVELRRKF